MEDVMIKISEGKKQPVVELRKSIPASGAAHANVLEWQELRSLPGSKRRMGDWSHRARGEKAPNDTRKPEGWIQNPQWIVGGDRHDQICSGNTLTVTWGEKRIEEGASVGARSTVRRSPKESCWGAWAPGDQWRWGEMAAIQLYFGSKLDKFGW